ncbi:MAG: hypothetical protein ABW048_04000 [Sphingobium sp.]
MTEKTPPETKPAPATSADGANPPAETAKTTDKGVSSKVWMGTAVGVGSAALVAALMYAKRRK